MFEQDMNCKRYTPEQKMAAVVMKLNGVPLSRISREIGCTPATVYSWVNRYSREIAMQHYAKKAEKVPIFANTSVPEIPVGKQQIVNMAPKTDRLSNDLKAEIKQVVGAAVTNYLENLLHMILSGTMEKEKQSA